MRKKLLLTIGIIIFCVFQGNAQLVCALNGTYTIDKSQPTSGNNFASFNEAVRRLDSCGVSGHVVFNVIEGVYNETFRLGNIEGASDTSTITMQAAPSNTSSVEISYAASGVTIILLDSVSHFSFRGFHIKDLDGTRPDGRKRGVGISISGISENMIIENNRLPQLTTLSGIQVVRETRIYNCMIRNNIFEGNSYFGVSLVGTVADYSSEEFYTITGTVVKNNVINDGGIRLSYQNYPVVRNNRINGGSFADIPGVSLSNITYPVVSFNRIFIDNEGGYGLTVEVPYGSFDRSGLIANNMIRATGTAVTGINITQGHYLDIIHNSVEVKSSDTSNYAVRLTLLPNNNSGRDPYGNVRLVNNIFSNAAGGRVIKIQEPYTNLDYVSDMNHNDYYTHGDTLGIFEGRSAKDLAEWQFITRTDANSISADPHFSSDFYATSLNLLSGKTELGISVDIDSVLRPSPPAIGASELLKIEGNCDAFTTFEIDSLKDDSFKLNWIPGNNSSSYYLEYGPVGFAPGSTVGSKVTGTYPTSQEPPLHITGLLPNTDYDLYFGEVCNSGSDTVKLGKMSITTTDSCPAIGGADLVSVGMDSAYFVLQTFNEDFNIEWGPAGYKQGTGTSRSVGSAFTIDSLQMNETYDLYIRTNCVSEGNGISDFWYGPVTFTTACNGPLSGNYTIGSSPGPRNFDNFREAADALSNCGISGSVVINVAGTAGRNPYQEQFTLGDIPGISAQNTVTIQAQSPVTNPVNLKFSAREYRKNYVINLEDASYVTIKDLNIEATGQLGFANAIIFSGRGHHITLENNTIEGRQNGNKIEEAVIISAPGSHYNNCTITDNIIKKGTAGIYFLTGDLQRPHGNVISYNTIEEYSGAGIGMIGQDSVLIHKNIVRPSSQTSVFDVTGIQIGSAGYMSVTGNVITAPAISSMIGIMANGLHSSLLSNNMISFSPDLIYGGAGIYLLGNRNLDIIHNSIRNPASGSQNNSRALWCAYNTNPGSSSSNIRILNNNLIALNDVFAIEIEEGATEAITKTDHNNLYAEGEVLGIWGNSTAVDLSGWQAISLQDSNSVSGDPLYLSSDDLHAQSQLIHNKGIPVSSVSNDFDEEARSPTAPDIGADEFMLSGCYSSIDMKAVEIYSDSIKLNWKPGAGSAFHIQYDSTRFVLGDGNLITGISDSLVTVTGLYPNTTYDFYLMDYCDSAGSSNGDTSSWIGPVTYTTPCRDSDLLSGTYTIDSSMATSGRNFASFREVETVINECGINSPVILNVAEGTYQEQIELKDVYGISETNTITFHGDPSNTSTPVVDASMLRDNYVFRFTDMAYVTVKDLILSRATAANYGTVIKFKGQVHDIVIEDNEIIGIHSTLPKTDVSQAVIVNENNNGEDRVRNITIRNNQIVNGSNSIYWYGGSGPGENEYGTLIEGNQITGFSGSGINCNVQDSILLLNNVIEARSGYGIYVQQVNYFDISSNRVVNAGIEAFYCGGSPNKPNIISNNMISLAHGTGVELSGSDYVNVIFNSVHIKKAGEALRAGSNENINIFNNNLIHSGGGLVLEISSSNYPLTSDYNNIYSNGSRLAWSGNGGDAADLVEWQNNTGFDSHSTSVDPMFLSPDSLYATSPLINNKGVSFAGITEDIDGVTRSATTPDIGASEFTPEGEDVLTNAIIEPVTNSCGDSSAILLVKIGNAGNNPVSGFTVSADISGSVQASLSVTYSGTLNSGQTDTVELSSFNSVFADTIHIKAYVDYSTDEQRSNDTIEVTRYINPAEILEPTMARGFICEAGVYDTLYFPSTEDDLVWLTTTGDTLSSNDSLVVGPLTAKDTTFILSAETGCYAGNARLKIKYQTTPIADFTSNLLSAEIDKRTTEFDAGTSQDGHTYYWDFGDGNIAMGETVSHDYTSNGNYDVRLIAEGNCGKDTIIKTVVISGISLEENILSKSLEVYPNPTTDKVQISFETYSSKDVQLQLSDLSGKVILQKTIADSNGAYKGELDLGHLAKGNYMLWIESGELKEARRIIKQ